MTERNPDDARHLTLKTHDVDEYHLWGPTAVGFLSFALKTMGKDEAKVVERDRDYGRKFASMYAFVLTW